MSPPTARTKPPDALSFGNCSECPYVNSGSAGICYQCARQTIAPLPNPRCEICEQRVEPGGTCGNTWCHDPERQWDTVWAVSTRTGPLDAAIKRYKYKSSDGRWRWGWGLIFGRVIAGFLSEFRPSMEYYDLIVPSPAFTGPGSSRPWNHIDLMVAAAANEAEEEWPILYSAQSWPARAQDRIPHPNGGLSLLILTADPGSMAKSSGLGERRAISERIYQATRVTNPDRVKNKKVLVVDDVFTSGSTLQAYARRLREAGAVEVDGLVLARSTWGS